MPAPNTRVLGRERCVQMQDLRTNDSCPGRCLSREPERRVGGTYPHTRRFLDPSIVVRGDRRGTATCPRRSGDAPLPFSWRAGDEPLFAKEHVMSRLLAPFERGRLGAGRIIQIRMLMAPPHPQRAMSPALAPGEGCRLVAVEQLLEEVLAVGRGGQALGEAAAWQREPTGGDCFTSGGYHQLTSCTRRAEIVGQHTVAYCCILLHLLKEMVLPLLPIFTKGSSFERPDSTCTAAAVTWRSRGGHVG